MSVLDITFEAAFKRLFVYNILFEDCEVDGRYLRIDEDSRVLGISAAGCGLASMVRFRPRHIDAIDINGHHLALAALKMKAARDLRDYDVFYDMFGRGRVDDAAATLEVLIRGLPEWMQRYWRKNFQRFEKSLLHQGLTAWMLAGLREYIGLGSTWMSEFVALSPEERAATIRTVAEPVFRRPLIQGMLNSPFHQLALGVNYAQRDRMLTEYEGNMVSFMLSHLERVARTDCETNWFAWYAAAGHYNHDHPEAVPPYLRRSAHANSISAPTSFAFHHEGVFDVLARASENVWTHYSLCDLIDWLPRKSQRYLFDEILRTARPGATVLIRSVHEDDVVASLGLDRQLIRRRKASDRATLEERSCQYKRVDFYEVV